MSRKFPGMCLCLVRGRYTHTAHSHTHTRLTHEHTHEDAHVFKHAPHIRSLVLESAVVWWFATHSFSNHSHDTRQLKQQIYNTTSHFGGKVSGMFKSKTRDNHSIFPLFTHRATKKKRIGCQTSFLKSSLLFISVFVLNYRIPEYFSKKCSPLI